MVKLFITTLALLATTVHAGPMATCGEQSDCIRFSTPERTTGTCTGDCEYKVCLDLSGMGTGACVKSASDTVSHSCVFPQPYCSSGFDFTTVAVETPSLPSTFVECQTGKGGDTLYFLLKDGAGCADSSGVWPPGSATPVATCAPNVFATRADSKSCTGNASGVECIWTYTLPTCEPTTTPAPTPAPSCPKGSGVCYTSDCHCVMGNCKITESTAFANVLQGYTGADGWYTLKSTCESGKALSNAVKIPPTGTCVKEDITVSGSGTTFQVQVIGGKLVTPFSMKCGTDCFIYDSNYGSSPEFPWTCNAAVVKPATVRTGEVLSATGSAVGSIAVIAGAAAMVVLIVGVFVYKKRFGTSEKTGDNTFIPVLTPRRDGDNF